MPARMVDYEKAVRNTAFKIMQADMDSSERVWPDGCHRQKTRFPIIVDGKQKWI